MDYEFVSAVFHIPLCEFFDEDEEKITAESTLSQMMDDTACRWLVQKVLAARKTGQQLVSYSGEPDVYSKCRKKIPALNELPGWVVQQILSTIDFALASDDAMNEALDMSDVFPYVELMTDDPRDVLDSRLNRKIFRVTDQSMWRFVPPNFPGDSMMVIPQTADEADKSKFVTRNDIAVPANASQLASAVWSPSISPKRISKQSAEPPKPAQKPASNADAAQGCFTLIGMILLVWFLFKSCGL